MTATAGPWKWGGSERTTSVWVKTADGKTRVCTVVTGDSDLSNARLISAAPDLLHALETLAHIAEHPLPYGNAVELAHRLTRARAAIAKARGAT